METTFWHERWQNRQIGFHQRVINPHLQTFWQTLAPAPECPVFVPLCGKSLDMVWLAERGYRVIGVELSAIAIAEFFQSVDIAPTRQIYGKHTLWQGGQYQIWQGDFFNLPAPAQNDLAQAEAVYDRAALVALPANMRVGYIQTLTTLIKKPLLLITFVYDQTQVDGPPFSVPESEVRDAHIGFGKDFAIHLLYSGNTTDVSPRFVERGLMQVREQVFAITPLPD